MDTQVPTLIAVCFRCLLCLLGMFGNGALLYFSMPAINCRIEPYKILLINLAMSNLITNVMVDIPGILVEIYGTWFLGDLYCKIFWFTASLSITSSILTTFAMSVFWYYKVVGSTPRNCSIFRKTELRFLRVSVSLGWLVSIIFSIPMLYFCSVYVLKDDDEDEKKPPSKSMFGCHDNFPSSFQKNVYFILYLILANGLPIIGMFFINLRIIVFLVHNRKRITALKCPNKGTSAFNSPVLGCRDQLQTLCQGSEGMKGGPPGYCEVVEETLHGPPLFCISSVDTEKLHTKSENPMEIVNNNVDKEILMQLFLQSLEKKMEEPEQHKRSPASIIYDPFMVHHVPHAALCNWKDSHLVPIPKNIFVDEKTDQQILCGPVESNIAALTCVLDAKDQLPARTEGLYKRNYRDLLVVKTLTANISITQQIRAAMSIMTVVGVFAIFWVVNLAIRIKETTSHTQHVIDTASLIATSYTTIIPYVFIYSMRKCPCG